MLEKAGVLKYHRQDVTSVTLANRLRTRPHTAKPRIRKKKSRARANTSRGGNSVVKSPELEDEMPHFYQPDYHNVVLNWKKELTKHDTLM